MLETIRLKNVGSAPEMKLDLAPRLNLITGDNGLGKSFLLDVAAKKKPPPYEFTSTYEPARARWTVKPSRPPKRRSR